MRLAALSLVFLLAGNVLAGVPMNFGDGQCNMHGMDCCKAALTQEITPEVADAKLYCALQCAQNGTTSPGKAGRVSSPSYAPASTHPAIIRTLAYQSLVSHRIDHLHGPPASGPVYLRNLALLI